MVNLTINGIPVQASEHTSILTAAASVGIEIPTLCYLKDVNQIGACRVCMVEVEGVERLLAACTATVSEGMVVHTNSPRVREARRINVELILSQHNDHCASCVRSGNCTLQTLCNDLGITEEHFEKQLPKISGAGAFLWCATRPSASSACAACRSATMCRICTSGT